MKKIFISTIPFGEVNSKPIVLLSNSNFKYTINPLNRKLTDREVAGLANDYDGIIAGTENLRSLIEKSKKLKIISRVGIGLDSVPLLECKKRGIKVTYTPDAVTMAVAELFIGLIISLTRHVSMADRKIRTGIWKREQGKRIGKSVIGIIGFGRIGTNTVKLLAPFKPECILVNDIKDKSNEIAFFKKKYDLEIRSAKKEKIYRKSDIISLHVPLSNKTRNLINSKTLSMMHSNTFLLNLARGGIINEQDLYKALKKKIIGGAAIDCFENEPYSGQLIELDNVLLTQHMGSCSYDCRAQMEIQAVEDIIRFFKNETLLNEVPEEELEYQSH